MAAIPSSLLKLFAPIDSLLSDPSVRRVLVDGPNRVRVERGGHIDAVDIAYSAEAIDAGLCELARRAGKSFGAQTPCLEAILKDGTRFVGLRPPVVAGGPVLCVIRPSGRETDLESLVLRATESAAAVDLLERAMAIGLNIAVCGAAGTGRTTLVEAMIATLSEDARIAVFEEFAELRLPGREPMRLSPRKPDRDGANAVSFGDLFYCAGRFAVDRVIVSEVRRADVWDALALLAARSAPVLLALPGLTPEDALARFDALARAGAGSGRERAVPGLIAAGFDLMVCMSRAASGDGRVVSRIAAVVPDHAAWHLETIFARTTASGALDVTLAANEAVRRWGLPPVAGTDVSAGRSAREPAGVGGISVGAATAADSVDRRREGGRVTGSVERGGAPRGALELEAAFLEPQRDAEVDERVPDLDGGGGVADGREAAGAVEERSASSHADAPFGHAPVRGHSIAPVVDSGGPSNVRTVRTAPRSDSRFVGRPTIAGPPSAPEPAPIGPGRAGSVAESPRLAAESEVRRAVAEATGRPGFGSRAVRPIAMTAEAEPRAAAGATVSVSAALDIPHVDDSGDSLTGGCPARERTMVTESIPGDDTARTGIHDMTGEVLSDRTFSQVLRTIGDVPDDSLPSGSWSEDPASIATGILRRRPDQKLDAPPGRSATPPPPPRAARHTVVCDSEE